MRLRIVGLGDSTTAGTPGLLSPLEAPPDGRGNPESQYAYWMMKAHPDWTVLNRGINGQRTDDVASRFERDVLQERPDYVIVLVGVNDVYQHIPLNSVKENLLAIYEKAIAARITLLTATVLPYNTASVNESEAIRNINSWIRDTASRLGALFCDTNQVTRNPSNPNRLLTSPDGLHPDASGYRKMGEAIAETIVAHLKADRGA